MYLLGTLLIVAAVALALLSSVSYTLVARGRTVALPYARFGVYGTATLMAMIWSLMIALFLARRFDIDYVNSYSSTDLNFFFTIAASWAGQPGSFAIWALFGVLAAPLLIRRTRHFEPYVLAVFMIIQAALIFFMLVVNPFVPTVDPTSGQAIVPAEGQGLNPLLHNFWMIIHPPVLFVGYALAAVPFAFAIAGLIRRDYDTWAARALPWTVAAWVFLGLALLLGGYWAYETLGWGGYWGWDPVENASLVPWLLLTALMHGMVLQRSHGGLRRTNFVLALAIYITVFYATFLTRSGVLSNFSVHSFVAEGLLGVLLGYLLLITGFSFGVFVWRFRDIPGGSLSDRFFSRDSFFVLAIITLAVLAIVVTLGTSMPVISAIPGVGHTLQNVIGQAFEIDDGTFFNPQAEPLEDGRFALTASFFQRTSPPLGLVVVVLLIIGPLLGWRDTNPRHLLRALRWPALAAVLAACVALLIDVRDLLSLSYVALATFAAGTNLLMLVRTLRGGWLRIGGYLAHLGFTIMLIGVVGSSAYATPEERLVMETGETVSIYGLDVTFNRYDLSPDGVGVLDLTVRNGNSEFSARPQLYFNEQMGSTMQTPAIQSYIWQDIYISPAGYDPERDPARPVLGASETAEMGPYQITFIDFVIDREAMMAGDTAEVGALLHVLHDGEMSQITPKLRVNQTADGSGQVEPVPAILPGGEQISLVTIDPNSQRILLDAPAMELPIEPAQAIITVSLKPLVLLVWVGVGISVVGGLIALLRRYVENNAYLAGANRRLPRGLAGLAGHFGWRGATK